MSEKIFREKSLKKITSSEELNDYVKVASPGVWLILASVIALFVGLFVWGIFGRVDTTIKCLGYVKNNEAVVYVKEEDIDRVDESALINIGKTFWSKVGDVTYIAKMPQKIDGEFSENMLHLGDLKDGDWVYEVRFRVLDNTIEEDYYSIGLIVESFKPITLLFN